jgi:hypothetical protein
MLTSSTVVARLAGNSSATSVADLGPAECNEITFRGVDAIQPLQRLFRGER